MFAQIINIHMKISLVLRIKENLDYIYIYSFPHSKAISSIHVCDFAYTFKEAMHITIPLYVQQSRTAAK